MSLRSIILRLRKTSWLPALLLAPLLANCAGPDAYGYGYGYPPQFATAPPPPSLPISINVRGARGGAVGFSQPRNAFPLAAAPSFGRMAPARSSILSGANFWTPEERRELGGGLQAFAKAYTEGRKNPKTRQAQDAFWQQISADADRDRRIEEERQEAWREAAYR
jgi:hypothetical protein